MNVYIDLRITVGLLNSDPGMAEPTFLSLARAVRGGCFVYEAS